MAEAASGKPESSKPEVITIDDLFKIGYISGDFDENRKCFTAHWHLGYWQGFMSNGYVKGLAAICKDKKEYAKSLALADIKKQLGKWITKMSPRDKEVVLDLKSYRDGKPQNVIKIENFKQHNKYRTEFYVRGMSHYVETFSSQIEQSGEHFILHYKQDTMDLANDPYNIKGTCENTHWCSKTTETYHDEQKAINIGLEKIKEAVKSSMAYHGMDEAKDVKFEIVERN